MDKKLFASILNCWKICNSNLSIVSDCINGRNIEYGQREILINLFKGINRRSFRIVKLLEEARLKDEKDEIIEEEE